MAIGKAVFLAADMCGSPRPYPNSGGRRLLARVSVTGLEVPVMRIPYRSGFLAAKEGGQIPCRAPVLDGRGSGSSGHSQAMAGGLG